MTYLIKTKRSAVVRFENNILSLHVQDSERLCVGEQAIVWFSCNVRDGNNGDGLFGYGEIINIQPLTIRFTHHLEEGERILTQEDEIFVEARNNQTNWRENKQPVSDPIIQEFAVKALYYCPSRCIDITDELAAWLIGFF